MYILVDVTSMYASCEKVFDPGIRQKPVVVLTNNDGCICAACPIAKKMGVGKKFVPFYQVKNTLAKAGAVVRSSNYELYADLSQKMMAICSEFAPYQHIYSIDECFLYFGKNAKAPAEGWYQLARTIRQRVWKEVRLPVGVGVGVTPTLAKAANYAAKKLPGYRGIAVIDTQDTRSDVLSQMAVTDVWGIGDRLGKRLGFMGINSAAELARCEPRQVRRDFSIVVENTVRELNGECRLSWDDVRAPKKEIYSTRSFGQKITDLQLLRMALVSHAEIIGAKLRKQHSATKQLHVFAHSSPHDSAPLYRRSVLVPLSVPTSDSRIIAQFAHEALSQIYRSKVRFAKCGIGALELSPTTPAQPDLFSPSLDNPALMACWDKVNGRFGKDTLHLAGKGLKNTGFSMRREFLSPQYTTKWSCIPKINC